MIGDTNATVPEQVDHSNRRQSTRLASHHAMVEAKSASSSASPLSPARTQERLAKRRNPSPKTNVPALSPELGLPGLPQQPPSVQLRHNPKRKAAVEVSSRNHAEHSTDNLLEEALKPLTAQEIEEWEGWIELESEPVSPPPPPPPQKQT